MNTKEVIINASRDFLEFNTASHLVRWVMVVFLLFCGVPQKTVAAVTNYADRQVRNIRVRFENAAGREEEGAKYSGDSEVYRGSPPLHP